MYLDLYISKLLDRSTSLERSVALCLSVYIYMDMAIYIRREYAFNMQRLLPFSGAEVCLWEFSSGKRLHKQTAAELRFAMGGEMAIRVCCTLKMLCSY